MKGRIVAVGLALTTAWVGCTLTKNDLRQKADTLLPKLGEGGRLIVPKLCAVKMAIITRPVGEAALEDDLWRVADAQAVGDEPRRILEANGLRVGKYTTRARDHGHAPAAVYLHELKAAHTLISPSFSPSGCSLVSPHNPSTHPLTTTLSTRPPS